MSGRPIAPSSLRQTCKVISKRQCRAFSSTIKMDDRMGGQIMRQMRSTQSMDAMRRKMKRSDLPDDLGLVNNTFIMPAQLPAILSNDAGKITTAGLKQRFKKRYHLKWLFLKQKVTDFLGLLYMNKWDCPRHKITYKRIRRPLRLVDRYTEAIQLHRALYEAIAAGDREAIGKIACNGLRSQLRVKLDRREGLRLKGDKWDCIYRGWNVTMGKWSWLYYPLVPPRYRPLRILADRSVPLHEFPGTILRQVVVQIKSEQTLLKAGSHVKKENKVENFVIQKMILNEEEDDWKVWGTVKGSTEKDIEDMKLGAAAQPSFTDRLKTMASTASTGTLPGAGAGGP